MSPLTVRATPLNLYVSVGQLGGGVGGILEYTPSGTQTTFVSGLQSPRGLAFDATGNFFVATTNNGGNPNQEGKVLKFAPSGMRSIFGGTGPRFLEALVTDSTNNVFVMGIGNSSPALPSDIFKFTPGGTRSVFGSTPGQSFGLAFNSAGDLFAADVVDSTIYEFMPDGTRSVFAGPSAFASNSGPIGLAFDSAGNLFVSTGDTILQFTPTGSESTFASGLNSPRGLAFDSTGDLFVAETLVNGDILKFTPTGTKSTFASGLNTPEFLTFGPARAVPDRGTTLGLLAISAVGLFCVRRLVTA
jgi:sugar lactone lactonase YvrE